MSGDVFGWWLSSVKPTVYIFGAKFPGDIIKFPKAFAERLENGKWAWGIFGLFGGGVEPSLETAQDAAMAEMALRYAPATGEGRTE